MPTINVTHALCRGLASTFEEALQLEPPPEPINVVKARAQHDDYTALLRQLGVEVLELPGDDACPDCVFIEDTALVINQGQAVITRPGGATKRLHPCRHPPAARRTNDAAVAQLRELLAAAGGPPVYSFSVTAAAAAAGAPATLHFKSVLSALDARTLLVADNAVGRGLAEQISADPALAAAGGLQLVLVPEALGANVLSVGRHVVMQEGCPGAEALVRPLCAARGLQLYLLGMGELAKADGALTCCSILFAR
ncbi:N(G),N(G)-dimethylarginine dimethylaminohydrolase 1 [Tetrabaena socialis]|uniref:N(G),N(G)-dimethylarginine dimethylaminohydrolase 1 n=1 Tax=Tetrabaena socialis TaxID=47790 RepID=A0A2J8AGY2_9CHLO|nr:N(G),N(G)-dimethylarginine dimethylaminohydrolase 1 [Tetrabaena socialis]|eukprot:PNH11774.1 N(G),N(G)-dimethylarginine dimethylaminohydrolase 1 [Tetrabaena socialis]